MRILNFLAVFYFVKLSSTDNIAASYRKDVVLTANHSKDNLDTVQWYYIEDHGRKNVFYLYGKLKIIGENYTGRVELDFITATLTISDLQCLDNKTYICDVREEGSATEEVARHALSLGLPDSDELNVTIQTDVDDPLVFPPGDCDSTPPLGISTSSKSVDVTMMSSVLSAPGVTFTVDGEAVPADCHPDGQCPGEVRCSMEVQHTIDASDPRDIIISINYEDVEPWTFCIRPVVTTATGSCECAAYWSIWVPVVVVSYVVSWWES